MNEQEFRELLAYGREQYGVEFKGPGSRKDKHLLAKVIRAVLSMANRRNGGIVIVGIEEKNGELTPVGISDADLRTWNYDDFADSVAKYADPGVTFDLQILDYGDNNYAIIDVKEFEDIPVLCKRSYQKVLRAGACYVRTRRKPETIEIPTQSEMRDLLDLATTKALRRYVSMATIAGLGISEDAEQNDSELFNKQIEDLVKEKPPLYSKIKSRGYWRVIIRPTVFIEKKVNEIPSLLSLIDDNQVKIRGWSFPYVNYREQPHIDLDWIGQEFDREHHKSIWRLYQSGQFLHIKALALDWRDESTFWPAGEGWEPGNLLSAGDTIATLTEIFEFAARLSMSDAGSKKMHIKIVIGNLQDRFLYIDSSQNKWPFDRTYQISIDEFPYVKEVESSELITNSKEMAINVAKDLFQRFHWNIQDIEVLRSWQQEFRV
jgi:hypothetical protein